MRRFALGSAISAALLSILIIIFINPAAKSCIATLQNYYFTDTAANIDQDKTKPTTTTAAASKQDMSSPIAKMTKSLRHAKITPYPSSTRGHADHGWLNTYHSFSFAGWYNPDFTNFGALRVLNEDRVEPQQGFPTHPHRNFEIFSYVLSGELTHRDSMITKGREDGVGADRFYRMRRGDVQFTTGGTGIAHSEFNEHERDAVHFLQIWALPWKSGLSPRYHTRHFGDEAKREGFVKVLSPLKAGEDATAREEEAAEPAIPGTIPIHADFVMGAGIIAPGSSFEWVTGGNATKENKRKVFVHLPMTENGKSKIRIDGREDAELSEGDGAFVEAVNIGDKLQVESIGEVEAEVIVLDTA